MSLALTVPGGCIDSHSGRLFEVWFDMLARSRYLVSSERPADVHPVIISQALKRCRRWLCTLWEDTIRVLPPFFSSEPDSRVAASTRAEIGDARRGYVLGTWYIFFIYRRCLNNCRLGQSRSEAPNLDIAVGGEKRKVGWEVGGV